MLAPIRRFLKLDRPVDHERNADVVIHRPAFTDGTYFSDGTTFTDMIITITQKPATHPCLEFRHQLIDYVNNSAPEYIGL